ncbi:hypothetical protein RSAG8_03959, partial [Rhizoctonia solani AG-8 WAC10335]
MGTILANGGNLCESPSLSALGLVLRYPVTFPNVTPSRQDHG